MLGNSKCNVSIASGLTESVEIVSVGADPTVCHIRQQFEQTKAHTEKIVAFIKFYLGKLKRCRRPILISVQLKISTSNSRQHPHRAQGRSHHVAPKLVCNSGAFCRTAVGMGIPIGFPMVWVWDGYGDRDSIPMPWANGDSTVIFEWLRDSDCGHTLNTW